jgi:DNA-binding SARP family transcriptional activator/tetratricopeptide (TPR) repeat protein
MADRKPWRIELFGEPALHHGELGHGTAAVLPLAAVDAAWVAVLAVDGPLTRDALLECVWPKATPARLRHRLNERLSRLRQRATALAGTPARLFEVGDSARLADDMQPLQWPRPEALARDPAAWDLQMGGALDYGAWKPFERWLSQQRGRWVERRALELEQQADNAEAEGDWPRALVFVRRALETSTLSEPLQQRLVRLLHTSGDTAGALLAFERFKRALHRKTGDKPSDGLVALVQSIASGKAPAISRPAPLPLGLLRPVRLIGREDCLQQLRRAQAEQAPVVLVGEAGIGKTRLIEEWVAAQPSALHVRAAPGDAVVPFGLAMRWLHMLLPRVARPAAQAVLTQLDFPQHPNRPAHGAVIGMPRLVAAFEDLLRMINADGLRCMAIDDLHHADLASSELIFQLLVSASGRVLNWLLACRPPAAAGDEGSPLHALADIAGARLIRLRPWTPDELIEFVQSIGDARLDAASLAGPLVRHTGGHPLYVLLTLRELVGREDAATAEAMPVLPSTAELLDQRLRGLSPTALALAQLAAVAGPDMSTDLAERALAEPALKLASPWRELEEAAVFKGAAFAHDLVREAALRATPVVIRAHLSRLCAEFVEQAGGEPARAAAMWAAGQRPALAAEAFMRAAERARFRARAGECQELLAQAAASFDAAGMPERAFEASMDRMQPLLQHAEPQVAIEWIDSVLARPINVDQQARAWLERAEANVWAGRFAESLADADRSLALCQSGQPLALCAQMHRAAMLAHLGRMPEALSLCDAHLPNLDALPDPAMRASAFSRAATVLQKARRVRQGHSVTLKLVQACETQGTAADLCSALLALSASAAQLGSKADMTHALERALAIAASTDGVESLVRFARVNLAAARITNGRFTEAISDMEGLRSELASSNQSSAQLAWGVDDVLIAAYVAVGQMARARALSHGKRGTPLGGDGVRPLLFRAMVERAAGQDWASTLEQAMRERSPATPWVRQALCEAMLLSRAHNPDSADRLAALHDEAAVREEFSFAMRIGVCRLQWHLQQRRVEEVAHLVPALERGICEAYTPMEYWPGLVLPCVDAYEALGDRSSARRCLHELATWVLARVDQDVPEPFRDSFIHRNASNKEILRRART